MPIYTFKCEECGLVTTKMISVEARDADHKCSCGGDQKRGIDRPGLVYAPTAGGMR